MEKARTLMDEAQEEHAAHLADMAKLPGVSGAFARLVQQVDPNNVPIFIKSEVERGTSYDDITAAIADAIGLHVAGQQGVNPGPDRDFQLALQLARVRADRWRRAQSGKRFRRPGHASRSVQQGAAVMSTTTTIAESVSIGVLDDEQTVSIEITFGSQEAATQFVNWFSSQLDAGHLTFGQAPAPQGGSAQ